MSRLEDRFRELCAAWVLEALDGEELREFEALLKDASPQMIKVYHELEDAALHLPVGIELVTPPPVVKARIMEAIRSGEGAANVDRAAGLARWLGLHRPRFALSVMLALTVLVFVFGFLSSALYRTVSRQEQRVVALSDELERRESLLQVLQARELEVVALQGLEINPRGYGKIIWDIENRVAVLQVSNLPPVPENKVYQLWVFPKEGEPASAGVFALKKPERDSFFRFEGFTPVDKQSIKGYLITLEPEGGALQPSEAWYMGARVAD